MIYLLQHTVLTSAARFPDHEAFVCGPNRATYGELSRKVRQLAQTLQSQGVQPGDRVGIYLNRCLETAVAIYGVLSAGAVYVPLNPKAPAARNAYVIGDCNINILITHPSQKRGLKALLGAGPQVQGIVGGPVLDGEAEVIDWNTVYATEAEGFEGPRQVETDLAYIIYTSGSTGKPKGIMHSHASGLAFARNAAARYGLNHEDRFGNHAPIYFDISQLAYFAAPLVGGTAVIATDAETIFPASLGKLMERERITVWYSVPLALVQLINSGTAATLDLDQVRHLFYAGEALAPKYARELFAIFPQTSLGNWYGPAETNVCTCYDLPGPPAGDEPIPIGDVWQNTDRLIIDTDGNEVSPGETGELLIRATTQMMGYWKLPERSAQAWFTREVAGGLHQKFYRTGDLVREDESGILHFLGRADHQVKVRGYRVELGAIERLLLARPTVREACALAVPSGEDEALALRALVILHTPASTNQKELLAYLKEELPWYAIPETITFRDHFPRTGTDKIDRKSLAKEIANIMN